MKIKYVFTALLAGATLMSCNDYLDVESESQYNDKVVFSNTPLAENTVISIYSWFAATNSHRARYMPYYGMNTDAECYFDMAQPSSDNKTSLCTYSAFSANNWMASGKDPNAYTGFFNGIEAANCCIEGIRAYGNPESNADMAYLLGESLTLRAQYYYDLIRAWGDVPARFTSVKQSTIYLPKSDRDVIYKQIIADLKEAAGYLPWPGKAERTKTTERVNKAFALGLRARLILMAEGYSQRPTSLDNPTTYEVRRSNDPELTSTALLQEAYDDLKLVIRESGLALDATYEQFWNDLATDVITIEGSHKESIFEIPFNDGRGRFFYHFGVYHKSKSPHLTKTNYGGQNIPAPTLYYEYDNADQRRDVNCVPYKYDNGYTMAKLGDNDASAPSFNFGKYDYERMTRQVTSNDDGVNLPVLRYADILLMAAEIANELEGPDAAKPYLKEVRNRAFAVADRPANVEAYVNAISSKADMLKAIQKERLLEFPGEMLRKQDLIRWNLLGTAVRQTVTDMRALRDRTGKYADVPTVVYTRTNAAGKLEYYGLAKGETAAPAGEGWTQLDYDFVSATVKDNMLANYFANDPDSRQYWPIFDSDINASNNALINNYGY